MIRMVFALTGLLTWQATNAATPPTPDEFAHYAESLLAETYPADGPGAAVLVMRGGEVLYRGARGRADVAAGVPLKPGDRFRIGSVTKQFTAVGLLKLVDAGKVSLEDPLSKYVPTYPGGERITIEQLLNHTSGIGDFPAMRGRNYDVVIRRPITTAQLIDHLKDEPPIFAPGEGWGYSNPGYVLAGAVIEAVSGQPWHVYLDQALFRPLGMNDTGYGADPVITLRQAKGYSTSRGILTFPLQISMSYYHASGALVSTVDDLARWNRALHEGHVLEPVTYTRMLTPVGHAMDHDYGYGIETSIIRGVPALHHMGSVAGFGSYLTYVPGAEVTVAVLHNKERPSRAHEPDVIARRLAAAALGDPYPPMKPVAVDATVLRQYEGVYRVAQGATYTLRVVDGHLTARRNGAARLRLTPITVDTFLYPDGLNRLQVLRDAGGMTGVRFWSKGEGEGVVAPLTDLAVPIDIRLPRDAFGRLVDTHLAPVLLICAVIAMLHTARLWRRRKHLSGKSALTQSARG